MSIYSDKLAHIQVIINSQYSVAQIFIVCFKMAYINRSKLTADIPLHKCVPGRMLGRQLDVPS